MAFISLKVPESRHIVDSTLFHSALCASQFRVRNRYHIMTPVYVSVIYFCIRSVVIHLPNTAEHLKPGVFDLRCSENQDTGDKANAHR